MKTLWMLFAFFLSSAAWAEIYFPVGYPVEPCINGSASVDGDGLSFVCDGKKWRHYQNACEVKMEAAMRAMEPYLNTYNEQTGITTASPFKGAPTAVMQQWEQVKKECWRPDR